MSARAGGKIRAGTIYSLTKVQTRKYWGKRNFQTVEAQRHTQRPIRGEFDPALKVYVKSAPSARPRSPLDDAAERLHDWDPTAAPCPIPLDQRPSGALRFILPIANWLAAGAPLTDEARFDTVIVDEAQDMGSLELAAALALVAPGGRFLTYGDPGQAIFSESKGCRGARLPAAWRVPGSRRLMHGGYRVGEPLASAASRILRPIWDRPAESFAAPHETRLLDWFPSPVIPKSGLILGYSRKIVETFIQTYGLKDVPIVPSVGCSTTGLVVCTGHAAKGAQADDVYLLPWRPKAVERLDAKAAYEVKLLYTMMTRARSRLHVPAALLARINTA